MEQHGTLHNCLPPEFCVAASELRDLGRGISPPEVAVHFANGARSHGTTRRQGLRLSGICDLPAIQERALGKQSPEKRSRELEARCNGDYDGVVELMAMALLGW
jgi:hypothetical protein